jgi:signal transduction histidine kinase
MTMTMTTTTMTTTTTDRRPTPAWPLGQVRLRIVGSVVVLLALATVASVLIERSVLRDRLDDDVDAALAQEVAELRTLADGRNPATGELFGTDVAAIFDTFLRRNIPAPGEAFFTLVAGQPYKTSFAAPYPLDQDPGLVAHWNGLTDTEQREIDSPAGRVRYLAVPLLVDGAAAGVFVVAIFLDAERREVDAIVRIIALVSLAVLLGASALAWVVAGRALAPVRLVTDTARSITESDLTRRIPVRGRDEISRMATTFNDMLDRLDDAFSTQRAFLDDAGHELRTPITIIRGHLELMGDDAEERRETLELVMDELDRMTRLVDDLLLLAKSQRPDFLQPQAIELAAFTHELHAKMVALAPRRWDLESVGSGVLDGDRQRLTQAVMNLARNAAQQTDEGGAITLGSAAADGWATLWVRDTGPGVRPADRERIFDRFARGTERARRSDGAGLGLAIAGAIVEAHRGRIELVSRPGQGATFTVVLPLRRVP